MKDNPLKDKSYQSAVRIVKLSQYLRDEKREFVLSKQVLRSGTAVGALIRGAEFGQSKPDFTSKMSIALKEANETEYWLSILRDKDFLSESQFLSLQSECKEIIAMLVSPVKTLTCPPKTGPISVGQVNRYPGLLKAISG